MAPPFPLLRFRATKVAFTLLLVAGTVGCAAQPSRPAEPPPTKQAQEDPSKKRTRVPHVAPPPAYGNKVVFTDVQSAAAPSESCEML